MLRARLIFSTLVLFLYATSAFAASPATDPPVLLEGITIAATPIDEADEDSAPAHLTVIKGEALQERFTSVPEILSETVGVKITRFGGLGDFSAISIRGSSSEQVLVYLDGFLLNTAQGGAVDMAKIPASQIESIEVYRGSAPVSFGQTGIGGIVNIRTKAAAHEKLLSYQLQYGSFGTSRLNMTLSAKPGKTDLLLGVNHEKSDNNFEFLSGGGTQFTTADDKVLKRENSQFKSLNLLTKVGVDLAKKRRLNLYYNFLDTEKGVPGLGAFQSQTAQFKTQSHRSSLRFDADDLFQKTLNIEFALKYALKNEAFRDLEGDIGVGNQDNDNKTQLYEVHLKGEQIIGMHQILKTRLQYRTETFKPFDKLISATAGTSRQQVYTLGVEDQIAFFDERLFITPSLLYEDITNRFKGDPGLSTLGLAVPSSSQDQFLTRQIGVLYRITETTTLRANIGRYFRRPSLFELFGDRGGAIGNPDLLPEKGLNRDIGLHYNRRFTGRIRKLTVQAAYFDNAAENLILFIQTSQFTGNPENIAKSRIIGQEFSGGLEIGNHFKMEGNYTHQRAINKSDIPNERNKFLPGRPVHDLFGRAEFYSNHFALYYSHHLTDKNFLDRANQRNAASRQIHNIGFSIKSYPRWSLTFEAKNLGDDQIEDVFGFPLPGRSYFVTLKGAL